MKQEVVELRKKMESALALAPRIDDLAKVVSAHYKEQGDTNSVLLSEIATFKLTTTPTIEAQLKQHTIDISSLVQRFNQLYTFTMNLFYPAQAAAYSIKNPFNYLTNVNVPDPKVVQAF